MKRTLHCSCAARSELAACEIAPGVSGQHCSGCDGHMLIQDVYSVACRTARAQHARAIKPSTEDGAARICSACARLKQRYRPARLATRCLQTKRYDMMHNDQAENRVSRLLGGTRLKQLHEQPEMEELRALLRAGW